MVVDKSERESWSGAMIDWIDAGVKTYAGSQGVRALIGGIIGFFKKSGESELPASEVNKSSNNNQGSGAGRGKNNRKPDPNATGDHSVTNDKGSTTFKKNSQNPKTGYDEVERIDTKGEPHRNSDGTIVPTPHKHVKGQKDVIPLNPKKDPMPRSN